MAPERLFTRAFLLCFGANLVQGVAFNLFLHLPGFLKGLGADELVVGLLSSLTALAAIGVRPWVGRSMDLHGRRPVILAGALLNVAVCGLYLTVRSIGPWVIVLRVAHGLAEALLFASLFTFAADHVPAARRTQGLALFAVSSMLPISLGGILGDALLARHGYDAVFLTALGFAAVALLLSLPLRDGLRPDRGGEPPRGFRHVAFEPDLVPLWLVGTVFSLAVSAVFVFVKLFVEETGFGSVGLFFTSYAAVALVLRVFFGWLPDRIGPKRLLFPALITLALGFVLLALAASPRDVAWAGALCGAGHGFTFPILFGMVVTRAREVERGAAMSIFTALFDAGVLVGGPFFGWVHGQRVVLPWPGGPLALERYPLVYATGALVLLVGTLAYGLLDRGRRPG